MKAKFASTIRQLNRSFGGTLCMGAVLLMATGASAQNLFVSDYGSDIYQVTPGGTRSTFASTGMDFPWGLAFNSSGDLFVANSDDNGPGGYITEITPGGTQSTFATGVDTVSLAVDSTGDVYAADYRSGNIYEYTPGGVRSTIASGFANPISLAINHAGNLFVGAGYGNNNGTISEIMSGGAVSLFASGLSFPAGLAFNSAGSLFASSQTSGVIYEYSPSGTPSIYATVSSSALNGLAVDTAGDLFAANASGGNIVEIAPGGAQSSFATIPTGTPSGLAFQPVPEPSAFALAGLSGLSLMLFRRRLK